MIERGLNAVKAAGRWCEWHFSDWDFCFDDAALAEANARPQQRRNLTPTPFPSGKGNRIFGSSLFASGKGTGSRRVASSLIVTELHAGTLAI
jgi:hypothetical protein